MRPSPSSGARTRIAHWMERGLHPSMEAVPATGVIGVRGASRPTTRRPVRKRQNPRRTGGFCCARYWDRTSDLFRVREARYRCANRACSGYSVGEKRGGDGIRTRVNGFAGRCLASRPHHHVDSNPHAEAPGGAPALERMTRLELATPTLARLCATNCATSALCASRCPGHLKYISRGSALRQTGARSRACPWPRRPRGFADAPRRRRSPVRMT